MSQFLLHRVDSNSEVSYLPIATAIASQNFSSEKNPHKRTSFLFKLQP